MHKLIVATFLLMLSLLSCEEEVAPIRESEYEKENSDIKTSQLQEVKLNTYIDRCLGSYFGEFEAVEMDYKKNPSYTNKINITLNELSEQSVRGYSIVAGNKRHFFGKFQFKDGKMAVKVSEPGDDKYDGVFDFSIDTTTLSLEGQWLANNRNLAVPSRTYKLIRKNFQYVAHHPTPNEFVGLPLYDGTNLNSEESRTEEAITSDILKVNASTDELKKSDIENMFKGDLEVIRNAIYARHGYSFQNRRMRYLFDRYAEWYLPVSIDVRNELTAIERANIELLKRYEEHAEKYYDDFGR